MLKERKSYFRCAVLSAKKGFFTFLWGLGFYWAFRTALMDIRKYKEYKSTLNEKKDLIEGKKLIARTEPRRFVANLTKMYRS